LFRYVFEAIFKVKVNLGFHKHSLHKLHVLVVFSYLICMDLVATLIFFNLFDLFFRCFYGVLVDFLVLDLEIGERKYIKTIIFSLKYVVSHIFNPMANINIYNILELMCYLSCEILFSFYFSYEILFK
jgi:hypothetical protein